MTTILGRLISIDRKSFIFGCNLHELERLRLGQLVSAKVDSSLSVYAIITNLSWTADELIRALAQAPSIPSGVLTDQYARLSGPAIQALTVGEISNGIVTHILPGRLPLSLSEILICEPDEAVLFTELPNYLRLLIHSEESHALCDVFARHFQQMLAFREKGDPSEWRSKVLHFVASELRDQPVLVVRLFTLLSQPSSEG
jgi:hypothetical protein